LCGRGAPTQKTFLSYFVRNPIIQSKRSYLKILAVSKPLPMNSITLAALPLGLLLGSMIFLFIFRIVLSWYPQVEMTRFPFNWVYLPTEPFLSPSRKLIPPLGGVDITPILWVGIFSLLREILLGQQGLITMAMYTYGS